MTSSDSDVIVTEEANVLSSDEIASAYERWEAPTMVSVSDIEESQLKIPTADEIEAIRKAAQEDGYKDGFEKGRHDGLAAGKADIQQQVSELQTLISTLNAPLMGIEEVIEQQVVNLTTVLTRQVVMNELAMTPDSIATLFRAAISQLPLTNRQLTIRIHPDDLSLVQKGISESEQASWTWLEDKSLTRGGLDIDSIDTHIDATVETRIKSAIEKLLGESE
jgi:flagellar assembly protein FliH